MNPLAQLALRLLAVFLIIATGIPIWRHDGWWVRAFDFPRLQILIFGLCLAAIYFSVGAMRSALDWTILIALGICLAFHAWRILPFTPWVPVEVAPIEAEQRGVGLSLLVANVFMENRQADALLDQIRRSSPDMVFAVETDDWWAERLRELEEEYPFVVEMPLDNTYGLVLRSRLELVEPQIKFLVDPEIPSVHGGVRLIDGQVVRLHLVHPKPPIPTESTETTERDGELLMVGREVGISDVPTIVAGDFNDVAWSYTTRLMLRVSGLLDPRIGRGLFSSYHAKYWLLRWPLDHVLCSRHFRLVRIERLPAFGSDHFPILLEVRLEANASTAPEPEPETDSSDLELVEEKIEAADPRDDLEDVEPEKQQPDLMR